ncbi:aconitate hydratase [Holdemania massiliensis]|uniref:aconitate hydratase n=1 Tax=Holdemania massiliensis TaxID=1468449 RepID=UPI001F050976|nr:aconitate hydratase [Holdemania massiliensis]MCH1940671.1 aconitate hydratase [Holdemania massiliensis]
MKTLAEKILAAHRVSGELKAGMPIEIKIDQTLTQDATGTMAYLQFEAMGCEQVKTECSLSYVDHNTLQNGFENADDHEYLRTVADRYGIIFSRPGNGICHQVHLERFDKPGKTLLGSDSHTPTAGAMGMIAIGAGGLDVACAMAGMPFALTMPKIVNIRLKNRLPHGVGAKDIILKVLSLLSVKGGVGKIFEYTGDGILDLSVPERSTICNMGAELGATTSLFPSDENTHEFLIKQGRGEDFIELKADPDAVYDEILEIDCAALKPLVACPHSPDLVKPVEELAGLKVNQVAIGSCTNSSLTDLLEVARILKGKTVHPDVSLVISFGSKQVLRMLSRCGALDDLIAAGARLLEATCGPCIGMGQSPKTEGVSLRTFNRNFYGRSGTMSAGIYLVSPATAAASAIAGVVCSAEMIDYVKPEMPEAYLIDDSMLLKPSCDPQREILRGPNIKPYPAKEPLAESIKKPVMIKVGDNITTDHIMPAGAKILPYRSNIEKISEFCYSQIDPEFHDRCLKYGGGWILAGENYGQGSSREHAALAPMYLKIQAVIAKSYARIHRQNLINAGILPLVFEDPKDYERIEAMDRLEVNCKALAEDQPLTITDATQGFAFNVDHHCTAREIEILKAGGLLNRIRKQNQRQG